MQKLFCRKITKNVAGLATLLLVACGAPGDPDSEHYLSSSEEISDVTTAGQPLANGVFF